MPLPLPDPCPLGGLSHFGDTPNTSKSHGQNGKDCNDVSFAAALRNLAALHEREVNAVKAEVRRLRVQRGQSNDLGDRPQPQLRDARRLRVSPGPPSYHDVAEALGRSQDPFTAEFISSVSCASKADGPMVDAPAVPKSAGSTTGPRASSGEPTPAPKESDGRLDDEESDSDVAPCQTSESSLPSDSPPKSRRGHPTRETFENAGAWQSTSTRASRQKGTFLSQIIEASRPEVYHAPAVGEQTTICGRLQARMGLVGDVMSSLVVGLNTVILGVSTDVSRSWFGWAVVDILFACFFSLELIAKLCSANLRVFFCGEGNLWRAFETFLVVLAWMEVVITFQSAASADGSSILSIARVVRLVRITRILRLLRLKIFVDLVTMIRGTMGGMRTLFWSMVVICLPLYVIALVLRETLGVHAPEGQGAESFATVADSFFTMFRCIVASDCTTDDGSPLFVLVGKYYGWGFVATYCVFCIFMMFGLFNVIVAIFVENVMSAAKTNDQLLKKQRLRDQAFFADKMVELLWEVWSEYHLEVTGGQERQHKPSLPELVRMCSPMQISPETFEGLRHKTKIMEILRDLDVADEDQFNLFQTLDADGSGTLDVEELCEGIMKLRGEARRSDMVSVQLMVRNLAWEMQALQYQLLGAKDGSVCNTPRRSRFVAGPVPVIA